MGKKQHRWHALAITWPSACDECWATLHVGARFPHRGGAQVCEVSCGRRGCACSATVYAHVSGLGIGCRARALGEN